jgi:hypothetical protein
MNTNNCLYGALCGALVFAVLSGAAPKKAVSAAVLASPPEGRFELVQLHPNAGSEWSGILDTETGCTWVYSSQTQEDIDQTKISNPSWSTYRSTLGTHFFSSVAFDPDDYMTPTLLPNNNKVNGVPYATELARVAELCSKSRLQALQAAAAR